jgi:hypothetical protein
MYNLTRLSERNPSRRFSKTLGTLATFAAFVVAGAACLPASAQDVPAAARPEAQAPAADTAKAQQNYWGFGFGYVFNKIPISLSTFNVAISDLWYSHIFGDPSEKVRVAGTLGFYGFAIALPVPRVSCDLYFGKPTEDIQVRGGVGGFYDVAVGGHGGIVGEAGLVLKNRVDLAFMFVPVGTDSKRSYSEFLGLETKDEAAQDKIDGHGHYVELPYYGVKVGLRF